MERLQSVVVGAGVVGLAVARALARSGREVLVIESTGAFGTGTSSRNSEVVHAGIYYPARSLKARHCVQGASSLLNFCKERNVAHNVCGKLIVATREDQISDLARISTHAANNGVMLRNLSADEARILEPEVSCVAALHSPGTAVVDSHGFMQALRVDAEDAGATLAFRSCVQPGGRLLPNGGCEFVVASGSGADKEVLRLCASEVVNCAGLAAPEVARRLGATAKLPTPYFCKGSYFALQAFGGSRHPFKGLVYPVPEKNTSGLGVHATVDLAGQVRFGPDVEWLPTALSSGRPVDEVVYDESSASEAYAVQTSRADAFYAEVRRYWPGLPDDSLVADYSGIRPKLSAPGEPAADFFITEERPMPGSSPSLVSLLGIESPGLTASLSLAEEVLARLGPLP